MDSNMFATMQNRFATLLCRLQSQPLHPRSGDFDVDELLEAVTSQVDGTEDTSVIVVRHIPQNDRRLREVMGNTNHVLADCPSPLLFGLPFTADNVRIARYELIAALMVESGCTVELLDDNRRFERWQFAPKSNFFATRQVTQINEQFVTCFARRLVCFYGVITDVRVPNKELRDNFARANAGMTTEHVLQKELGQAAFNAWVI